MITGRVLPKAPAAAPAGRPPSPPPAAGAGGGGGGGGGGHSGGGRAASSGTVTGRRAAADRTEVTVRMAGGRAAPSSAHKLILAEYLAVMLILFATEILGPVGSGSKAPSGQDAVEAQSKSFSGILVRMTAASILFFVLALSASGERSGKMAAALGGLVTLGTMMNAGPVWKGAARVFGTATADKKKTGGGGDGGTGPAPVTEV